MFILRYVFIVAMGIVWLLESQVAWIAVFKNFVFSVSKPVFLLQQLKMLPIL